MGRSVSSRDAIRLLEAAGWRLVAVDGSHHQFKHPERPGRVTVKHPTRDLTIGVVKDIEHKSGLKLR